MKNLTDFVLQILFLYFQMSKYEQNYLTNPVMNYFNVQHNSLPVQSGRSLSQNLADVHVLMWHVPVSLSDSMVRCSRAVDGEWLERMPKATIVTQWGSPSWETSTVPFLIPALLPQRGSSRTNIISDCRCGSELGGVGVSQEAAAVWGLSGLPAATVRTGGTQRPGQHRVSRRRPLRRPTKTTTVSLARVALKEEGLVLTACSANCWQVIQLWWTPVWEIDNISQDFFSLRVVSSREMKWDIKTGKIHRDYACRGNNARFLQCPKRSIQVLACPARGLQRSVSDERREDSKISHLSSSLKVRMTAGESLQAPVKPLRWTILTDVVIVSADQLFICFVKNKDSFGFSSKKHFCDGFFVKVYI